MPDLPHRRMSVSWREAMDALDWVRLRLVNRGSPDFMRQQQTERRVQALCARLLHDKRRLDSKS